MKDSFVFYKSFYDAIKQIPEEYQLELYNTILQYSLEGIEPENLSNIASAMFTLIKPNIDSSQKKYEASVKNGRKGGRPKKPNNNPDKTQEKPNNNLNDNDNEDDNDIKKKSNKRKSPELIEIQNYIQEKNLKVDGKQFYDYFTEGNWIDSKGNKVKNWKQKLLTWDKYKINKPPNRNNYNNSNTRTYDNLDNLYANKGG